MSHPEHVTDHHFLFVTEILTENNLLVQLV